jgi:Rv0078B-related antitoxin
MRWGKLGMGGFRTLFALLAERRGTAGRGAFEWTPEAERMRSALEMHELGVQLYRQRMRREHPEASRAEIYRETEADDVSYTVTIRELARNRPTA